MLILMVGKVVRKAQPLDCSSTARFCEECKVDARWVWLLQAIGRWLLPERRRLAGERPKLSESS